MLTVVVIVLVALVAAVLFYVASRPDVFHIHRYGMISAPPDKVFQLISDFRQWSRWSPWDNVEGDELNRTFSGPENGEGAVYRWEGKKTGIGRMEIMRTSPPGEVNINLDFEKPMKAHNNVEFLIEPDGGQTRVDWNMKGEHNFMGKLFATFMNMDKMIGKDFEKGLAALKREAEKA